MQPKQNPPTYPGENSSPFKASPLLKTTYDYPFKSPLTSAQKSMITTCFISLTWLLEKFPRNRNHHDNHEIEHNNPFSGPTFIPLHENRDKFSPFSFTPGKVKEEFSLGDFTSNSREQMLPARPYESPYTAFCKDLSFSPGPYNFASPNTLLMRLQ